MFLLSNYHVAVIANGSCLDQYDRWVFPQTSWNSLVWNWLIGNQPYDTNKEKPQNLLKELYRAPSDNVYQVNNNKVGIRNSFLHFHHNIKSIITVTMVLQRWGQGFCSLEPCPGIDISWVESTSEVCTWGTGWSPVRPHGLQCPLDAAPTLLAWWSLDILNPWPRRTLRMHREVAEPSLWEQLASLPIRSHPALSPEHLRRTSRKCCRVVSLASHFSSKMYNPHLRTSDFLPGILFRKRWAPNTYQALYLTLRKLSEWMRRVVLRTSPAVQRG